MFKFYIDTGKKGSLQKINQTIFCQDKKDRTAIENNKLHSK